MNLIVTIEIVSDLINAIKNYRIYTKITIKSKINFITLMMNGQTRKGRNDIINYLGKTVIEIQEVELSHSSSK